MHTRLGLDIGTNSIGWWLYETDGDRIISVLDGGVRIFSDGRDPKSGASLAVDRRAARSMRRRRDRYLRRRSALMRKLAEASLMPKDPAEAKALESLDPYALRAQGLDEALPLHHLGRALFHLNQRRGFKSNRKTDRGDNESGKIKDATARLDQAIMTKGARSYGEFLHMRRAAAPDPRQTPSVRTRLTVARRDHAEKEEAGYDFYPDRRHLEEEFHKLWDAQAVFHLEALTPDLKNALFEIIFYQRPLKAPAIGLCLFAGIGDVPDRERRLPKAHPLTQRRTLYETVNNLRITSDGRERRPLTLEERDQVIGLLDTKKPTKTLTSMAMKLPALAKALKLPPGARFTLETANRDAIACDPVRASLIHPDRFGPNWSKLNPDQQWEVVRRIQAVESDAEHIALVDWLCEAHGLNRDHAEATAHAPLPEGYGRLGETATRMILSVLENDTDEDGHPLTYAEAATRCFGHHSDMRTGEVLDALPYYGEILERHVIPGTGDRNDDDITRFGRITNPTVHIGLNQLRRLVNGIITVHGKPDQIVVELARELKMSEKQKTEVNKKNRDNRAAAEKRSEKLAELGQADTGANRMILRLWEDLGHDVMTRNCPYTGQRISAGMLFDGSCDVDHILPYSRTLDDSFANRTLCLREANREKRNQTPWEAWGETDRWHAIEANLKNLPDNKRWRFAPDAMERFEGENDFLDRALVDTQYLSRIAKTYLEALYTEGRHVWVVPGRLTEMLRRHWGLNSLLPDHNKGAGKAKNRTDHRHHAIDAAVIAATDRGLINRISKAAGREESDGKSAEDIARDTPEPWEHFRSDIRTQLGKITVSHRADHGRIDPQARKQGRDSTTGRLHNDTAYGIVDDQRVVSRVPLLALKPGDIEVTSRGKNIRDPFLQKHLARVTRGKTTPKEIEAALVAFASAETLPDGKDNPYRGLRHVRLIESLQASARVVPSSQPFKAYKGDSNHCFEIWRMPDGKPKAQVITTFEAHGADPRKPHPAAKRLLRLFKRDMVAMETDGRTATYYVQKFSQAGTLCLAPHTESNADARDRDSADDFKLIRTSASSMVKAGIRRIFVDEMGRLRDPGPAG
ncbi:type II CRISPR RNA-guided endonuclease Cas9 [Fontisubflavum oceani]|uniref:type II CRISPR RNA-guided endonuclease Cas9 n=1 Tax=Fontisubflavum oceani TaxID=2978973 RepID=UPI0025B4A03A|nr:type II CRISPR RNA-guided endonuclease Cas9 [Fontisubflavum oceani]WJY21525.1 type II CRISPR RNA-guided endonuclease Cas9 [Fontisubflavum oceani]